jgi:cytochrome c-type biogenesis protein CcmH/NrfG
MTNIVRGQARSVCLVAAVAGALFFASAACRDGGTNESAQTNGAAASNNSANNATAGGDPAKIDAEIERLEKQAGKNPGNADTLAELARAYVRRGNAYRDAQRLREAMDDYRRAQRNDPDNEEAQRNAAEIAPQVEGTPTGEYGEPAPLPISPNVADDETKPTPTPKKP